MSKEILLSIIVPAYNVARWITRCMDSILAQSYRNIEVIVIDDGSTDETPVIIDEYSEKDQRVHVIHKNNQGLVKSREVGIKAACGEFVGFVDGDDEIEPHMYEKLINNAVKHNAQISQCGIMYCFYDGRRKPVHGAETLTVYDRIEGLKAILSGDEMEPSLCNKIYHASIIKDSCLDPTIVNNEDMLRNVVLFNRAEHSVMEDFCGYHYWRREESMSNNTKSVEIGKNVIKARELILEFVPEELKEAAINNYTDGAISIYNRLINDQTKEAAILKDKCRNIIKEYGLKKTKHSCLYTIKMLAILYFPKLYRDIRIIAKKS